MSTDSLQSQNQPVPIPTNEVTKSGNESSPATVAGATKADGKMLQFYINMVEEQIKEETNPTRQQNAQVCLEYVRQHGYPAQGYRFLIHQGKMEVLTEDESMKRKGKLAREVAGCLQDTYGLVCC